MEMLIERVSRAAQGKRTNADSRLRSDENEGGARGKSTLTVPPRLSITVQLKERGFMRKEMGAIATE
jgi:hypothetical protein